MHATEYIKIYHNNGRHLKIGSGSWPVARDEAAAKLSRHHAPLRGDENIEVEIWTHGQRSTVKSKHWREILAKMGDADASADLGYIFMMTICFALFQLLLPIVTGGIL